MHALELSEIVIEVVQYLSIQDQARCARVAKGWLQSFSPFLWFDVHIDDSRPPPCQEAFVRNGRFIRHLRVDDPHLINMLLSYLQPTQPTYHSLSSPPVMSAAQLWEKQPSKAPTAAGGGSNSNTSNSGVSDKVKGKSKVESLHYLTQYQPQPRQHQQQQHQEQQQGVAASGLCLHLTQLQLSCWEYTRRMMLQQGSRDYTLAIVLLARRWSQLIALNLQLHDLTVAFYGQVGSVTLPALFTVFGPCMVTAEISAPLPPLSLSRTSSSVPSASFFIPSPTALRSLNLQSYPLGRDELVLVLSLCPKLEHIRLEESPFPDKEDPAPCYPTPIPKMKYMQRLDFDFRRDPPAAIAIDLIEQCPQLKRLRIETENLYPFRYLPPLLRRKEISPKDKSDDNNQEERTVDDTDGLEEEGESDNEDGDDGGVVAVVKHDKHGDSIGYRPRSRDKTKRSQGCCPELHTLELEVCCEWVTTPTESETAALAQATMSSCRNLTLRGCAILDSLTENLLANGRWTRRLVTLDVIRSKNAQPLVLGVLEGCPSLQVLRASKLTLTSFIAWTDDRDPWMDGKPWVCLGLREWSVAVTGIERNHMRDGQADSGEAVRRRSGAVAGDDEDAFEYDDDEYGGEDMEDYEGREGDESVDNEDLEGDEEEEKTEEHEVEREGQDVQRAITITAGLVPGEDRSLEIPIVPTVEIETGRNSGKLARATTVGNKTETANTTADVHLCYLSRYEMQRLEGGDEHNRMCPDILFHAMTPSSSGGGGSAHRTAMGPENEQSNNEPDGESDPDINEQSLSIEDERADKIEQIVFQQLGRFHKLEVLRIGGCSSLDEVNEEVESQTSYALSFRSGLDHLAHLKHLQVFGAYGVHHHVSRSSLEWMVQEWPRLSRLEVLNYERASQSMVETRQSTLQSYSRTTESIASDRYQRFLEDIIA